LAFQESVIRYTQENQIPKKYLYYGWNWLVDRISCTENIC
jgi:hypothetical protein